MMGKVIDSFQGEHRFLSNFWLVDVTLDDVVYKSVEHAYMAAKTTDITLRIKIAEFETPGQAKRFCKTIPLRDDWEEVKLSIMTNLVSQKFKHKKLAAKLKATGTFELIEGNVWGDTFWGVCRGKGSNHLGKILMGVRSQIEV